MAMGTVRVPPKNTAVLSAYLTSATDGAAIVAASTGNKIRVLAMVAVASGAVGLSLKSATTAITAVFPLAANGGFVLPFNEHGWCETVAGAALNIGLGASVSTAVQVIYTVL